jgi:O-antigen/teichoic acid export membrane protein
MTVSEADSETVQSSVDIDGASSRPAEKGGESAGRAMVWSGLQTWGTNLIGLAVFVLLARLLSPAEFGLAASAYVVVYFLRVLVDAGFSRLLIQKEHLTSEDADTAFWSALACGVALIVLCCLAAPLFALLYGEPRLTGIIRALSPIFLFVALDSTQSALLQRAMRWRVQAIRRLGAAAASAAVAVVLALHHAGVWSLVGQQLALEGLTALLLWPMVRWRPRRCFSRSSFRELTAFGARYSGLRILWYLGGSVDNLLIGVFLGPVALGYYVVAYRVFSQISDLITTTLNNVALPVFSRSQADHVELNRQFVEISSLAAAVACPAFVGMALIARPAVLAVFGAKWTPSVPVLEVLPLAGMLQAQFALASSYVIAVGRVGNELRWTVIVLGFQVVGFAIAVGLGITAVALALGIVFAVLLPVRLRYLGRLAGLRRHPYGSRLPAIVIATGVMAAVVTGVRLALGGLPAGAQLAVEVAVGAAVYAAVFGALAPHVMRGVLSRVGVVGR